MHRMRPLLIILLLIPFVVKSQLLLYEDHKEFIFKNKVNDIDISHNSRFLAYGVKDQGQITILDLKVNRKLHALNEGDKSELTDIKFDVNDQYVVGAFKEKKIIIWDLISGQEEKVISSYKGKIDQIEISGNGNLMAVRGSLKEIYLYHFPSGELKGTLKGGHSKKMISCHFNSSGDELVSLGTDQQMIFWNCNDMRLIRKMEVNAMTMDGSATKVTAMDVGSSGDVIAVAIDETLLDKGGTNMIFHHNISLYDWRTATLIQTIEGNVVKMKHLQLSPDNGHVVSNNSTLSKSRVSFWSRNTGTYEQKQIIKGKILCFDLSPDGSVLAIGYEDLNNNEGTYVATFEVSGLGEPSVSAISKGIGLGAAGGMKQGMLQKDNSPKAFTGDLNNVGQYYALIIGINEYDDDLIMDLDEPVKDATNLYNILINSYTFSEDKIVFLQNPKRADIITALDNIENTITPEDNLLIFYAGHGYWDEKTQKGYWLPSDAQQDNTANWFRNSSLSGYIASINSNHTLLIADACFSGSIFKTRDAFGNMDKGIERLYKLPSRKAMTSGTLKVVPDKSVFLDFLTKRLEQNEETYLSSEQLFFSFKTAVLNNSQNIPQFGEIANSGDEGGDFIFIKKNAN